MSPFLLFLSLFIINLVKRTAQQNTICVWNSKSQWDHLNGEYDLQSDTTYNGYPYWKQTSTPSSTDTCPETPFYIFAALSETYVYWTLCNVPSTQYTYGSPDCEDVYDYYPFPPDPTQCIVGYYVWQNSDFNTREKLPLTITHGSCPTLPCDEIKISYTAYNECDQTFVADVSRNNVFVHDSMYFFFNQYSFRWACDDDLYQWERCDGETTSSERKADNDEWINVSVGSSISIIWNNGNDVTLECIKTTDPPTSDPTTSDSMSFNPTTDAISSDPTTSDATSVPTLLLTVFQLPGTVTKTSLDLNTITTTTHGYTSTAIITSSSLSESHVQYIDRFINKWIIVVVVCIFVCAAFIAVLVKLRNRHQRKKIEEQETQIKNVKPTSDVQITPLDSDHVTIQKVISVKDDTDQERPKLSNDSDVLVGRQGGNAEKEMDIEMEDESESVSGLFGTQVNVTTKGVETPGNDGFLFEDICTDCGAKALGKMYKDNSLFYCMTCWKCYECSNET